MVRELPKYMLIGPILQSLFLCNMLTVSSPLTKGRCTQVANVISKLMYLIGTDIGNKEDILGV